MNSDRSEGPSAERRPIGGGAVALAALVLGAVVGGLLLQALGHPRTAVIGGLAATLVAALGWSLAGRIAGRATLGGSAVVGGLAVAGAYLAAAAFGGADSPVRLGDEAGLVMVFSLWLVVPVGVAAGLAVGFVLGARGR